MGHAFFSLYITNSVPKKMLLSHSGDIRLYCQCRESRCFLSCVLSLEWSHRKALCVLLTGAFLFWSDTVVLDTRAALCERKQHRATVTEMYSTSQLRVKWNSAQRRWLLTLSVCSNLVCAHFKPMDLLLFIQLEGQFVPFGFVFSGSFIHNGNNIIHVAGEQGEHGAHPPPSNGTGHLQSLSCLHHVRCY